jgi:hypothetical protein
MYVSNVKSIQKMRGQVEVESGPDVDVKVLMNLECQVYTENAGAG